MLSKLIQEVPAFQHYVANVCVTVCNCAREHVLIPYVCVYVCIFVRTFVPVISESSMRVSCLSSSR